MKKFLLTPALAVMLTSLLGVDSMARPNVPTNPNISGGKSAPSAFSKLQALCTAGTSRAELDINNVRAMVLNGGDMWWDLNGPRYEVPKVDDPNAIKKHSMFAGSVWIGGTEVGGGGNLHLAAQTFRQGSPPDIGFWPGPLDENGSVNDVVCRAFDFHAKINSEVVEEFKAKNFPMDQNDIPQSILNWPGKGNPFRSEISGYGVTLAPFIDVDGDGIYDPRVGDYPNIKGNQSIWWVMNDAGGVKVPTSPTIGLELQVLAFAFESNDLINNMTFYEQTMINRGNKVLTNTYLAQWADPDLGNYLDDYVGCDVGRGLGYVFNGDGFDEGVSGYGENPPALGIDFFAGPRSDPFDGLDNDRDGKIDEMEAVVNCADPDAVPDMMTEEIIMSNFIYFNNNSNPVNGNPDQDTDYYNYMQSKWGNGNPAYYGGDGVTPLAAPFDKQYKFMFPGDTDPLGYGYHQPLNPIPGVEVDYTPNATPDFLWTERTAGKEPGDRRFIQSAGPFTLSPGQVLPLTIGVVWVRPTDGGVESALKLLAVADDAAQALFDNCFEQAVGPPAPDMSITELDRELIISLESATCGEFNTEDFIQLDNTYGDNTEVEDPYYRFQGYIVYQLKNPRVAVTDLNNPNLARIVQAENGSGQSDIQDDLGLLVNRVFNPDLGEYTSEIQVQGENLGVRRTLRVQRDMFATGDARLVNYKTYHYMVIAYASNPFNRQAVIDNFNQYRSGRCNVRVYSAIPHKVAPESGMVLNADPGDQLPVTRLFGVGNGGNVLDLAAGEEDSIVDPNKNNGTYSQPKLHYAQGGSPIAIRVYDPKRVARANFNLKLSSRLAFYVDSVDGVSVNETTGALQGLSVGDIIQAGPLRTVTAPSRLAQYDQIPGRARINRIVSTSALPDDRTGKRIVVLDLEMLNDEIGGTFETDIELRQNVTDPGPPITTDDVLLGYESLPMDWFKEVDPTIGGKTHEYGLHEFWRLLIKPENGQTDTIYSKRTLTEFDEQLLPDFGLSIQLSRAYNPGYQVLINRSNQFQEATLNFEGGSEWLTPVRHSEVSWLLSGPTNTADGEINEIDPATAYHNVLEGSWAPYEISKTTSQGGASYQFYSPKKIFDLPNINVVFTPDKNKWSKVVVLQADLYEPCNSNPQSPGVPVNLQKLLKSVVPSIDKDGNPIGGGSTGMGWFPGYAIDVDRGVRLNLMFAESRLSDPVNGNNLLYDPTTDPNGGKSFIYIMNTVYDEGSALEQAYNTIMTNDAYIATTTDPNNANFGCLNRSPNAFGTEVRGIFDAVTWVGNMRLSEGATNLANAATVRLRVNRQYNSFSPPTVNTDGSINDNPEYAFSTNGAAVSINNIEVANSALNLIRVVPNPYYAYSDYEQRVTDNIVKITNLPARADISIFNLNGTLVQTLRKDDPTTTYIDWNLKNRNNLSISSGVYIIHVKAQLRDKSGSLTEEEKVLKFFAILRPIDLQSF